MKKYPLLFITLLLCIKVSYSQTNVNIDTTAIGLGATTTDPNYKFPYQNHLIAHYGLGWYNDSSFSGGPMAYLGGYGGFKFFTQRSPRLTITAQGQVGIGTTSPAAKFEVYSGLSASTLTGAIFGNGSNDASAGIRLNYRFSDGASNLDGVYLDALANGDASGDKDFIVSTSAYNGTPTAKFIVRGNGNVGIGTTSPTQALTVNGTVDASHLSSHGNLGIGSDVDARIYMLNTTSGKNWNLISETDGSFEIGIFGSSPFQTITSSGNVGIGTTSPTNLLDIRNNQTAYTYVNVDNDGTAASGTGEGYSFSEGGTPTGALRVERDGTGAMNLINGNGGPINIQTGSSVAGATPKLTILAGGNIGIGTTDTKGYKLAVNGSVIATSVVVKFYSSWPDYVFKPTYHLTPLTEVKTYVDKNHHLPDMPSEKEVADNGLNLGEMNKLLTQKVEELTLYLIEENRKAKDQQKINQLQQAQIDQLKKQMQTLSHHLK